VNADLFWPAVLVGTAGNTLGGALTGGWATARALYEKVTNDPRRREPAGAAMLERFGARGCLLSWLPIVGDPLCAVAGWLRLPFWPCVAYMAIGKFARYVTMTALLLWVFPRRVRVVTVRRVPS
jgi:membrane protein YqaA with SNARE-associated domain